MGIDYKVYFSLNGDPLMKEVFKNILKSRTIARYQLEGQDLAAAKNEVKEALVSLEKEGLIERVAGQSSEKDLFYPSGSGLIAEKYIK